MSATTTTTRQDHLQDYDIRLSGSESAPVAASRGLVSPPIENPPGWYDGHRQVPPYRPVNTNLDRSLRPWGSNPVETAFVFHMLHGVWLKSSIAWFWNVTGGRFNGQAFTAKIGGEI